MICIPPMFLITLGIFLLMCACEANASRGKARRPKAPPPRDTGAPMPPRPKR